MVHRGRREREALVAHWDLQDRRSYEHVYVQDNHTFSTPYIVVRKPYRSSGVGSVAAVAAMATALFRPKKLCPQTQGGLGMRLVVYMLYTMHRYGLHMYMILLICERLHSSWSSM